MINFKGRYAAKVNKPQSGFYSLFVDKLTGMLNMKGSDGVVAAVGGSAAAAFRYSYMRMENAAWTWLLDPGLWQTIIWDDKPVGADTDDAMSLVTGKYTVPDGVTLVMISFGLGVYANDATCTEIRAAAFLNGSQIADGPYININPQDYAGNTGFPSASERPVPVAAGDEIEIRMKAQGATGNIDVDAEYNCYFQVRPVG